MKNLDSVLVMRCNEQQLTVSNKKSINNIYKLKLIYVYILFYVIGIKLKHTSYYNLLTKRIYLTIHNLSVGTYKESKMKRRCECMGGWAVQLLWSKRKWGGRRVRVGMWVYGY